MAGEQLVVTLQGPLDPFADFYQLRYTTDPNFVTGLQMSDLYYALQRTVTPLDHTQTWWFEARAGLLFNDAILWSDWSDPANGVPLQLEAPVFVGFPNIGETSITASWQTVVNAQSYRVDVGTTSGGSEISSTSGLASPANFQATGLEPETLYWFTCYAEGENLGLASVSQSQSTLEAVDEAVDVLVLMDDLPQV